VIVNDSAAGNVIDTPFDNNILHVFFRVSNLFIKYLGDLVFFGLNRN
jgi:hypothetical protein